MASGARSRGDSRPRFYDLGPRWSSHIKVEASEELGPKITNHGQDPSRLFLDLDPSKAICSITSSLSPCTSSLVHSRWSKKKQSGRLTLLFFFFAGTMAVGLPTCQGGLSSWSIKPPWKLGLAALRRRTRGVQYLSYPSTGIGRESLCCSRGASTARHTWHPPFFFFFFFSLLLRLHILEDQCFGGLGFGPENKDLG